MIDVESLKKIIEEVIGSNDQYLNVTVYDIIKKIIDLPYETDTTIADLINYNPNEAFVEPIKQEKIRNLVREVCKKLNIELEENKDDFGGLAYYYQLKKMPEKSRKLIDEEFDKYSKLYEERFNKRAYIPEPSGTKEFAIECIKKCLCENKDILDELYYPNIKKDK